jgi:hypothetical protein
MPKTFEPVIALEKANYQRIAIKTHKVMFGEDIVGVINQHAGTQLQQGDMLCLSQKVVAIAENNVVHISQVKAGLLAKLICRFVTKWPNDIGFSRPEKMQVAIQSAGYPRMILAVVVGGITRLFGRRGDFYRIAGNKVSEIDGFNPKAMPPFDQYAMVPVADETAVCEKIEIATGCPAYIIDGNNINVKVVAMSQGFAAHGLSAADLRLIMLDNPMGQDDELTPIFIIRKVN